MNVKDLKKEFRHRRSISQLMEEMDRLSHLRSSDSPHSFVNHGMVDPDEVETRNNEQHSTTVNSVDFTDTGLDQLSPDSEYDDALNFPDDSLTLVSIGTIPVLVTRRSQHDAERSTSSSSTDDDDDGDNVDRSTQVSRTKNEIPYEKVFAPPKKFKSFDRSIFIPGEQIHVDIVDFERSYTSHLLNPILYTIQLTHGTFIWTTKKRYKDFAQLHNQLRIFRTSMSFPLPTRAHKDLRSSFRNHDNIRISTISNSASTLALETDGGSEKKPAEQQRRKRKTKRKKDALPRFPKRPDTLIGVDQIPTRIKQLEKYLYNLLNISPYRNHHDTVNFLEVSNFSFISALGEKGRELMIKKRTGSTNAGQKKCNFLNCLACGCCVRCNYLCADIMCGQWQSRWLIVKESFIVLQHPKTGAIRSVILFDSGFEVSLGLYATGLKSGIQIVTNSKYMVIKFPNKKLAKDWGTYLKTVANTTARDFTSPNPFLSFAPSRTSTLSAWFVDGCSYLSAVADALEGAAEEIFIADWWLSPEIYLKRPTLDGEYWRLDNVLLRKAKQGIKIFIMLYKEVEMALGINSFYSKQRLSQMHENIKVLRHPDHVRIGVFFWAHHEKLVIVDQTYSFVGGIDLCYGRWDDYHHRLTDLGSVVELKSQLSTRTSASNMTTSTPESSSVKSLIKQSSDILKLTTVSPIKSPEIPSNISIDDVREKSSTEPLSDSEEPLDEHTKQNTPEMKRRGITEKIKDNVRSTINKFSITNDEQTAKHDETIRITSMHTQHRPSYHDEIDGQAKYWMGKDYTNFIFRDFSDLNLPFDDLIDRTKTPRMPWHDIASVVVGQASRDVARHFIERWNACKFDKARENLSIPYIMPKTSNNIRIDQNFWPKTKLTLERVTCQVLRSASQWSTGFVESDYYEESIHEAYVDTILKSQHYIYIENQFFISLGYPDTIVKNQIAESIYKRIIRAYKEKKVFRVFVVIPLLPGFEGDVAGSTGNPLRIITHWNYASICRAENSIIQRLLRFGIKRPSDFITFHSVRNYAKLDGHPVTELIYVHSKLMIVDDKTVIIGSANINDRSMLGKRDSEVAVLLTDEAFDDGKMNGSHYPCGKFAGNLRKHLMREHLGMFTKPRHSIDLADPICDEFYKETWQMISAQNTKIFEDVFRCIPNDNVRSFLTLKKYGEEPAMNKTNPDEAEEALKKIQGFLVDLPLNFLCEEYLLPSNFSREGIVGMNLWT